MWIAWFLLDGLCFLLIAAHAHSALDRTLQHANTLIEAWNREYIDRSLAEWEAASINLRDANLWLQKKFPESQNGLSDAYRKVDDLVNEQSKQALQAFDLWQQRTHGVNRSIPEPCFKLHHETTRNYFQNWPNWIVKRCHMESK